MSQNVKPDDIKEITQPSAFQDHLVVDETDQGPKKPYLKTMTQKEQKLESNDLELKKEQVILTETEQESTKERVHKTEPKLRE